jgi:hypothetical protein
LLATTECPGIYALGDCAEHNGRLYGMVAPAWGQAAVLAEVLSGSNPQARYHGSKLYARLKVAGIDVASMGRIEPELELDEVIQVVETRRDTYRKMIVRGVKLVGAILIGNTGATARLIQLFDRGDPLPADPLLALCSESSLDDHASDRLVCNCRRVTAARLRLAVSEGKACAFERLGRAEVVPDGPAPVRLDPSVVRTCRRDLSDTVPSTLPTSNVGAGDQTKHRSFATRFWPPGSARIGSSCRPRSPLGDL